MRGKPSLHLRHEIDVRSHHADLCEHTLGPEKDHAIAKERTR
jgi:hypothetical protein